MRGTFKPPRRLGHYAHDMSATRRPTNRSPSGTSTQLALSLNHRRQKDVDPPSSPQAMAAQSAAAAEWRQIRGERFSELKAISQPTLVVNGHHDVLIPTRSSYILSQHIPRAQLIIYPDSGHGALFQFPELFVTHGGVFLEGSI